MTYKTVCFSHYVFQSSLIKDQQISNQCTSTN